VPPRPRPSCAKRDSGAGASCVAKRQEAVEFEPRDAVLGTDDLPGSRGWRCPRGLRLRERRIGRRGDTIDVRGTCGSCEAEEHMPTRRLIARSFHAGAYRASERRS
jgi:hypothetical protein